MSYVFGSADSITFGFQTVEKDETIVKLGQRKRLLSCWRFWWFEEGWGFDEVSAKHKHCSSVIDDAQHNNR